MDKCQKGTYFSDIKKIESECIRGDAAMLKLEVKTKQKPTKVVQKIKEYIGQGSLGLTLENETPQCLNFEGAGGYVTVHIVVTRGASSVSMSTNVLSCLCYLISMAVATIPNNISKTKTNYRCMSIFMAPQAVRKISSM